jgi:hypothetical protein
MALGVPIIVMLCWRAMVREWYAFLPRGLRHDYFSSVLIIAIAWWFSAALIISYSCFV